MTRYAKLVTTVSAPILAGVTAIPPPPLTAHPAVSRPNRVREIGAFLAIGTGLSALYVVSGHQVGVPCPFKLITGWSCPLCGGTRMGAALMQGDLGTAFHYNPVALVGLTALGLWWLLLLAKRVGAVKAELPQVPMRWRLPLKLAAVLIVLVFAVGRNLPVGPLANWQV